MSEATLEKTVRFKPEETREKVSKQFFTCNVVVLERKGTELWEASECPASDALDPEILNFKVFFCIIAIMFWKSEP